MDPELSKTAMKPQNGRENHDSRTTGVISVAASAPSSSRRTNTGASVKWTPHSPPTRKKGLSDSRRGNVTSSASSSTRGRYTAGVVAATGRGLAKNRPAALSALETTTITFPEEQAGATRTSEPSIEISNEEVLSSQPTTPTASAIKAVLVEDADEEDRQKIKEEIRNELLQEVVVGEAIVDVEVRHNEQQDKGNLLGDQQKGKRRIIGCALLLLAIVIISLVLGLVLTGQKDTTTDAPTMLPTWPSFAPTVSSQPSSTPTTWPSFAPTMLPTWPSLAPTVSSQPSSTPTTSNESRNNTNREEAKYLELRSPPLEDPISSFSYQEVQFSCSHLRSQRQLSWLEYFPALWYTYTPEKSGPVTVIACGPVDLFVSENRYEWNCPYDDVMVGIHASNGDMGNCGGTSFSWEAVEGFSYNILLLLNEEEEGEKAEDTASDNRTVGEEHGNIFQHEETNEDVVTIQVVDNDLCEHAFGPLTPTSAGTVLSYTTADATLDIDHVQASCGGSTAPVTPGVWYTVKGTGRPVTASTCTNDHDFTTFDTQISVFKGDCGNLDCVYGNDDFCGQQSSVVWSSKSEEIYHVFVHGPSNSTTSTSPISGNFQLTLTTDFERLENDICDSATKIDQGILAENSIQLDLSLAGSTADPDLPCFESASSPQGIWYVFEGTGDPFLFSHYVYTGSGRGVEFFSGSCGQLSCLEPKSTDWGLSTWAEHRFCFPTNEGETYYIFVYTVSLRDLYKYTITLGSCNLDDFLP